MPSDKMLNTVLGAYQRIHDTDQTSRLLSSTTSLLTSLSNPLNVTLLTSQLLTAPAIWSQLPGLPTSLRIISIYNTAAITVRQNELDSRKPDHFPSQGGGISCDEWTKAVIKGADDRSARWQHLLVMAGVLLGMEGQDRRGLSSALRSTLEEAVVTAANLALQDPARDGVLGAESLALSLIHSFSLLPNVAIRSLDCDALALILSRAMIGNEGYQEGCFLGPIDLDVKQVSGSKFNWSSSSGSFLALQRLGSKPLISSVGSLSKLLAHSVDNLSDSRVITLLLDDLVQFSRSLLSQWRQNKLSEIDPSEESLILTPETRRVTYPLLWQTLKTTMFACVVVLRAILGRTLVDRVLTTPAFAPQIATKALLALRNIFFISSRLGTNAFSAYIFVTLTSIDILTHHHPTHSAHFLKEILPQNPGFIPENPLDRTLDLYYLNTSEHFTLTLDPSQNKALVLLPASPYLNHSANPALLPIFESAHSATLSVLSAPQNAALCAETLPSYTQSLFASFPTNLSPRQFRFAFKTLLQVASPPAQLSNTQPDLPDILAELLFHRAIHAPTTPLPPPPPVQNEPSTKDPSTNGLSEQSILLLTLIDALPFMPIGSLRDWLSMSAELVSRIKDEKMREVCKRRFWDLLEGGEMDVDRAGVALEWWTSAGGREEVLYGFQRADEVVMSGGLGHVGPSRL